MILPFNFTSKQGVNETTKNLQLHRAGVLG